jgi:hypothetical protein
MAKTSSRDADAALQGVVIAEQAVDLVESAVFPLLPGGPPPRLIRDLFRARHRCAISRANVAQLHNRRDDALAAWRNASDFAVLGEAPNMAALTRVNAAILLGGRLGRPKEALAELASIHALDALIGPVHRAVLNNTALMRSFVGDISGVRAAREAARAVAVTPADWVTLADEDMSGFRHLPEPVGRAVIGHTDVAGSVVDFLLGDTDTMTVNPLMELIPGMVSVVRGVVFDVRGAVGRGGAAALGSDPPGRGRWPPHAAVRRLHRVVPAG